MINAHVKQLWLDTTLDCDICGKDSIASPSSTALVLNGKVICNQCMPSNIKEAITANYYTKCKKEGCEEWLFNLESKWSHDYCPRCTYKNKKETNNE